LRDAQATAARARETAREKLRAVQASSIATDALAFAPLTCAFAEGVTGEGVTGKTPALASGANPPRAPATLAAG
jgi:hypothetical protein